MSASDTKVTYSYVKMRFKEIWDKDKLFLMHMCLSRGIIENPIYEKKSVTWNVEALLHTLEVGKLVKPKLNCV